MGGAWRTAVVGGIFRISFWSYTPIVVSVYHSVYNYVSNNINRLITLITSFSCSESLLSLYSDSAIAAVAHESDLISQPH